MDTPKIPGPLGQQPTIRQAEQTDTRQAIQRHDPEFERKRGRKTLQEDGPEEGIVISVEALIAFLEKLTVAKKTTTNAGIGLSDQTADIKEDTPLNPPPYASAAARAASAYSHSAQSMKRDTILLETTDTASEGPEMDLNDADVKIITTMLKDLKRLEKAGITTLDIEKAPTFIQSLLNAIETALSVNSAL